MITDEDKSLLDHIGFHLEPPPLARKHRVVCVDDESDVLHALERVLKDQPYELRTTEDPRQALLWLEQGDVSLLISDQLMPEISGDDLLDQVRKRAPATTRILLTGFPGRTTIERGLDRGVDWLISKPWNDEALKITLRHLLHQRELGTLAPEGGTGPLGACFPDPAAGDMEAPAADSPATPSEPGVGREDAGP